MARLLFPPYTNNFLFFLLYFRLSLYAHFIVLCYALMFLLIIPYQILLAVLRLCLNFLHATLIA